MREVKRTTTVHHNEPYEEEEVVSQRLIDADAVYRSPATSIVYYILNVIEIILALRLIFRLLGANPGNGLVNFLYTISAPLVAPFVGIFRQPVVSGSVLEWSTVIAMIIYAVVAYLIVQLIRTSTRSTVV
jgi:uncharacterized protein YggT (Ycf19 family)